LPRTMIPMMTSVFFDHWLLRWTMIYLADAIRVEASGFRRDVPEIQTAIAALDEGKCLVIFPEGRMRRSEDKPLKMFGQGVWHILHERPDTPVVVCWIEGGWGELITSHHTSRTTPTRGGTRPRGAAAGGCRDLHSDRSPSVFRRRSPRAPDEMPSPSAMGSGDRHANAGSASASSPCSRA